MHLLSTLFTLAATLCLAQCGYTPAEYASFMRDLAKRADMRQAYTHHVQQVLRHDPHYLSGPVAARNLARFDCPNLPPKPSQKATSVHRLTPYDIGIVAALGDSLTAAAGADATSMVSMLIEARGVSWSIGGDESLASVLTLPNIVKQFNPAVQGASTGRATVGLHHLSTTLNNNMAVSGNEASHMPGQARALVDKLKRTPNYQDEWKLITLFIGGNDACDSCKNPSHYHPDNYVRYIKEALDIFHAELRNTFVNLVPVLDVSLVGDLTSGLFCSTLHNRFCACGAYPSSPQALMDLKLLIKKYQSGLESLVRTGLYDSRDDFTVVVQPFLEEMSLPLMADGSPDYSFFAPDCFHFSRKAQFDSAVALWNNMFQRVDHKQTSWYPDEKIKCPSVAEPYLFTAKNSK